MCFTAEMSGMLEMQKFHLSYNILLPQRADSWIPFPSPRVCRVSVRSYADVITKCYYVNIDVCLLDKAVLNWTDYDQEFFNKLVGFR